MSRSSEPQEEYLVFPASQGMQSRRYFWMSRLMDSDLESLFEAFYKNRSDLSEDLAQRSLDVKRSKSIKNYATDEMVGDGFYIIPPVIVLLDIPSGSEFWFDEFLQEDGQPFQDAGQLLLPRETLFWLPDGQHRVMGMILAHLESPQLFGSEAIGVMMLADEGLQKKQQIFLDTNQRSLKPNKSIISLFDHRDPMAQIARTTRQQVALFREHTALEATNISGKSTDLITMNNLRESCGFLLKLEMQQDPDLEHLEKVAVNFWNAVAQNMPAWKAVAKAQDVAKARSETIALNAITLNAIAIVGSMLLEDSEMSKLVKLREVNWSVLNPDWDNMIRFGGRIVKNNQTTRALAEYIYHQISEF